jgi:DNA polymerase-3 subunit delta
MILFFYGEETYQSFHSVQQLKKNFLKKNVTGGGLVEFDCDDMCNITEIKQSFGEQNLFAPKKLIIIKNIFAHTKAPEQKQIIEKLKLVEMDVVVFIEEAKVRNNAVLFKWLKKNADTTKEYKLIDGYNLEKWITKTVEENGSEIDKKAVKELILFVGSDLWQLSQEIQKLICYANKKNITLNDVHDVVHGNIDADMFKTVEAIAAQDKKLALFLLKKQIVAGDDIFHIFSMYVYQVRTLVNVGSMMDMGIRDKSNIAQTLKLHPFVVQKAIIMTDKLSYDKVVNMQHKLAEIDFESKIGSGDVNTSLELFIMSI